MTSSKKDIDDMPPASAYEISESKSKTRFHTLAVVVDNEPGVLARVVGLFSGRGYNIESLTVSSVSQHHHMSRITLVTSGTEKIIQQIKSQLARLVPVHTVHDLTIDGNFLSVEMVMIKLLIDGNSANANKVIAHVEKKGGVMIKKLASGLMFRYSGSAVDIEQFVKWAHDLGKVELVRSGVIALSTDMKTEHLIKSDD